MQLYESAGTFLLGVIKRFYYWLPSVLLDPFDLYNKYFKTMLGLQRDIDMPSEAFPYVLAGGLLWAAVVTYHDLNKSTAERICELERENERIKELKPSQESLNQLSELLSDGIHRILNGSVNTDEQAKEFFKYESEWIERLFSHLDANFTKSDAIHVQRLGSVPIKKYGHVVMGRPWQDRHEKVLREVSLREERIRDLMKKGPARR